MKSMNISFKEKTAFGKKVTFIPNRKNLDDFFKQNPELYDFLKDRIT